jgi:hypothetical protein
MMDEFADSREQHEHLVETTVVLLQRNGVPYEVARSVCFACQQVLDERPLKRAAA